MRLSVKELKDQVTLICGDSFSRQHTVSLREINDALKVTEPDGKRFNMMVLEEIDYKCSCGMSRRFTETDPEFHIFRRMELNNATFEAQFWIP